MPPRFPNFGVVTAGLVPGRQTSGRGELFAFLRALQASQHLAEDKQVCFVTDAQYVHDLVQYIEHPSDSAIDVNTSNCDIIEHIIPLWQASRFRVRKVKSHRSPNSATDIQDLYDILGNACADAAVSAILKKASGPIAAMSQRIASFHQNEKMMLHKVFQYLVDLNKARIRSLPTADVKPSPVVLPPKQPAGTPVVLPSDVMGADALPVLQHFAPEDYEAMAHAEMPTEEVLQACQQGANMARAVVIWLQKLKWPKMDEAFKPHRSDWGISWIELFYDFHAFTGMFFPVRIQGLGKSSKYGKLSRSRFTYAGDIEQVRTIIAAPAAVEVSMGVPERSGTKRSADRLKVWLTRVGNQLDG
eukprot:Skav236458  [mRNA]  locus=scaffold1758:491624:494703:+ [translate_table: standard]